MNSSDHDADFDPFASESEKKKSASSQGRSGSGSGVGWLALILAVMAIAYNSYTWWQGQSAGVEDQSRTLAINNLRQSQATINQSLESLQNRLATTEQQDDSGALASIRSDISSVQTRVSEFGLNASGDRALLEAIQISLSDMAQRIADVETSVAALAVRSESPGKRMDLAEVDYLLRLAGERLALFGDTRSADKALGLADSQLEALDDPLYLAVRRRISESRTQLQQLPAPDLLVVSGQIETIQSSITGLPFPGEAPTEMLLEDQPDAGLWQRFKNALKPLVRVRRRVDDSQVLSLEDKDMLRQGLWLQLESSRLALMRNDSVAWDLSLARARESLEQRFDPGSRPVRDALQGIGRLAEVEMVQELPDISAAWRQLRLLREGPGETRSNVTEETQPPPVEPQPDEDGASAEEADDAGEGAGDSAG